MMQSSTKGIVYRPTPISGSESQAMRGVAILCIMFHNFLHLTLPTVENEFSFSELRTDTFVSSLSAQPAWALADVMSFLGWYGVAVFIFLSGYGLVRKYECGKEGDLPLWGFTKERWLKLVKLMLVPMVTFAIIWSCFKGQVLPIEKLAQQLALVGNVAFPTSIQPGVYWFFGLIFQLYILYRLCIYRRSRYSILILNIIALAVYVAMAMLCDETTIAATRHNCIGWILPFTVGAMFARYDFSALFARKWLLWVVVMLSGAVLTLLNYNSVLWYLSPIVAIVAAISLAKLWRGGVWLGALSSFLFAMHPIVRYIALQDSVKGIFGISADAPYSIRIIPLLASYIALSILTAMLYKRLHSRLFDHK